MRTLTTFKTALLICLFAPVTNAAALKITQLPVLSNSGATSSDVTAIVDVSADITKQFSLGEFDKRYHSANVTSGDNEGYWLLKNATYDESIDRFYRDDVSATAYAINLRNEEIPGTSKSGVVIWKVDPGLNPVSGTFNVSGGWKPLLALNASGDATLLSSPVSGDNTKNVATTEFVNYKRTAILSAQIAGGGVINSQWDGVLNDAFASVSQTTSGTIIVTMKSGYWDNPNASGPPLVFCDAYGSSTPYTCAVDTPLLTNPYTFAVTVYVAATGAQTAANVRLMAVGKGN